MRKKRILVKNSNYHVTARINRKEHLLEKKFVKEMLLSVLKRAKKKYRFEIRNFCIMDSHVHLIIKPHKKTNLSKLMQWILSVFAVKYNSYFGLCGHVWYDRFKSKLIKSFNQYLTAFLYIIDNPVRAGMVNYACDFKYGGLRFILNRDFRIIKPPSKYIMEIILNLK